MTFLSLFIYLYLSIYIYIYITAVFKTLTIFHISIIYIKKKNVIEFFKTRLCLSRFPFHEDSSFTFHNTVPSLPAPPQSDPRQANRKASSHHIVSHLKTHHTHQQTSSSSESSPSLEHPS